MRKIKIAQIGLNQYSHSTEIFQSVAKQSDIFEIVGYALPENEEKRLPSKAAQLSGYKQMTVEEILSLPEIEAVTIETDEIYLTKYALMAAKAGKHIHMEKPGGVSLSDFEELINTMKESGKIFHTGYMYRYNPNVMEIMKRVKSGELGEIYSVEAQMNSPHPKDQRRFLGNFPGGIMFFLGCHLVDLVLQIKGTPQKITTFNKSTGKDGVDVTDFGMAVFEYENGASFIKSNSSEIGGFIRRQLVINAEKGTIEVKPFEINAAPGAMQVTDQVEYRDMGWNVKGDKTTSEIYNRYDLMMNSFAKMVRGEIENPYTLDYELQLFKTVLKCCEVN